MMRFYNGWCNMPWGGGGFMMFFWIILIAALIYALYYFISKKPKQSDEALELLKMKYARGEISEEEYLNKKSTLSKK
jgi:putative membrane protein